jgi:hypothetical protein
LCRAAIAFGRYLRPLSISARMFSFLARGSFAFTYFFSPCPLSGPQRTPNQALEGLLGGSSGRRSLALHTGHSPDTLRGSLCSNSPTPGFSLAVSRRLAISLSSLLRGRFQSTCHLMYFTSLLFEVTLVVGLLAPPAIAAVVLFGLDLAMRAPLLPIDF